MTEKQFERVLRPDKIVNVYTHSMTEEKFIDRVKDMIIDTPITWDKEESTIKKDFNRGLEILEQMRKQEG